MSPPSKWRPTSHARQPRRRIKSRERRNDAFVALERLALILRYLPRQGEISCPGRAADSLLVRSPSRDRDKTKRLLEDPSIRDGVSDARCKVMCSNDVVPRPQKKR